MQKIFTLNLNYYVGKHGPWEKRKEVIVRVVRDIDPDVILFQAVAKHPDLFDGKDQAQQLREQLSGFQSHYFQEAQTLPDGTHQGNAVIAKERISGRSHLALTLEPGRDDTHHRIVTRTTFKGAGGDVDIYNAHFSWVAEQALVNVRETVAFMKNGNRRALLGGDLNTTGGSAAFQPFVQEGYVDAWEKLFGNKEGNTFESDRPSIRIDYFWLAPALMQGLKKVSVISPPSVGNVRLSDHLGLFLELSAPL